MSFVFETALASRDGLRDGTMNQSSGQSTSEGEQCRAIGLTQSSA